MNYSTEGEELVQYLKSPAMNLAGVVAWLRSHDARVIREAAEMISNHHNGYTRNGITPEGVRGCQPNCVPCMVERRASEIEAGK